MTEFHGLELDRFQQEAVDSIDNNRSVVVAANLEQALAQWGGAVSIRHREIIQNVGSVVDRTDWPAQ